MKKILALALAACLLLTMCGSALATDKVSYFVRGGTAEYEPYLYETLVGLRKIHGRRGHRLDRGLRQWR